MEAEQVPTNTNKPLNTKPTKKKSRKMNFIALAVVAVVIVLWVVLSATGAKAKYQAESTGFTVVDPATVSVSFKVTNTGNADGKPSCTINAQDDSAHYTGTNVAQLDTVKAGATANSADTVIVTGQGAQYVTKADVTCN